MAMVPVTFTLPDTVIGAFNQAVPASRQSAFVADVLMRVLLERDRQLMAACDAANTDSDLNALVEEWQAMREPSLED